MYGKSFNDLRLRFWTKDLFIFVSSKGILVEW